MIAPHPNLLAEHTLRDSGINYNPKNLKLLSYSIKIPHDKKQKILFEEVLMAIHKTDPFDISIINEINEHFKDIQPPVLINRLKSELCEHYNTGAVMGLFTLLRQPIDTSQDVGKYLDAKSGANLAQSSKLCAKTASDASMVDICEARKNVLKV